MLTCSHTPAFLDDASAAYVNFYAGALRLSAKDAKQLQRDLVELFLNYKAKNGDHSYSLSLVLAPCIHEA